jgi:hypothetical protein
MRIEIMIMLVTGFLIANVYTDGKYWKLLQTNQKYYKMAGIAVGGLMMYVLFKKFPSKAQDIIRGSNEYIKYLPIDRETTSMLSPILDFTAKQNLYNDTDDLMFPVTSTAAAPPGSIDRLARSGGGSAGGSKATKRSVSETKKKFVASSQNWKCGDCSEQLSAWFEVDHKVRLEYGGSNHIDNLVALCRECHGRKTTMENL